jgi:hypothetical protein
MGPMNLRDDAVKRRSFAIAEMMAIVAIVALDSQVMRAGQPATTLIFLALGGLPMQGVLAIGLLIMLRRRRLVRKPVPFLVGFEVVGWICLLIYVVLCFQTAGSIDVHLGNTLNPLLHATGLETFSTSDWIIRVGLAMSFLTVPQLAAALLAGWIGQKWWKRTHPERLPTPV